MLADMKTLTLIRHAKSSSPAPALADIDRRLEARGMQDARLMAEIVAGRNPGPDLLLCSPAVRARATAEIFADALGLPASAISFDGRIYAADTVDLLEVVRGISPDRRNVFLVGHNPGLLEFAEALTGESIGRLRTCSVLRISLQVEQWIQARAGRGILEENLYPKLFRHK